MRAPAAASRWPCRRCAAQARRRPGRTSLPVRVQRPGTVAGRRGPRSAAQRSGEWRDGIARLAGASLRAPARVILAPYLDAVAACNPAGRLIIYPGSPWLARALLRAQDRLIACELEPNAATALAHNLAGDRRSKALTIDGWTALNAYVPPKERRGLVLIDPAYENAGDFGRLPATLAAAHRKWASGTYLVWYPIKERTAPDALADRKSTRLNS